MANQDITAKMEDIFKTTCGSWENCNQSNIVSFLSQCYEQGIDPQFCVNWLDEHSNHISQWSDFSHTAQEWVNEHTASGSPIGTPENQEG